MATITQSRKRAPIANGELYSVGAWNWQPDVKQWEGMTIGIRQDAQDNNDSINVFTTLKINREEAKRIAEALTKYLNQKEV